MKEFFKTNKFLIIMMFGFFICTIVWCAFNFADTDLYFLIPEGQWNIENNAVPYTNPFITTPNQGIVEQNWLYSVLIAGVYNFAKSAGLLVLQAVFLLLMFICFSKFIKLKVSLPKVIVCISFCLVLFTFGYINLRPEMLTIILCLFQIIATEKYLSTKQKHYLWVIPLMTLIEINCHASYWIMHYIILLPYLVKIPSKLRIQGNTFKLSNIKDLILPIIVSFITLFINPYGVDCITYVFTAMKSGIIKASQCNITEMQVPELTSIGGIIIIVSLIIFVLLLRNKKLSSETIFFYLGFAFLNFTASKWINFLSIGLIFVFRDFCDAYLSKFDFKAFFEKKSDALAECKVILTIVAVVKFAVIALVPFYMYISIFNINDDYLEQNFKNYAELYSFHQYLKENDSDATILASYECNNYFEFLGYKVYYDARPEIYIEGITHDQEPVVTANSVFKGYDTYTLLKESKNGVSSNSSKVTTKYFKADEYDSLIESVNVDYYIVPKYFSNLIYALEKNESFEFIMDSNTYVMYKNLNS